MNYIWDAFQLLLGLAAGKVIWDLIKLLWRRHQYPYSWKCPQCDFYIRTNVWETYDISKSSHNHSRLREYKPQ